MALKIFTSLVTLKLLSSRLSTEDTPTSRNPIEQTFNGTPDFGRKVVRIVPRNGDLILSLTSVELPGVKCEDGDYFRWVNWVGHALIKTVEVEIGGQRIDKHSVTGSPSGTNSP